MIICDVYTCNERATRVVAVAECKAKEPEQSITFRCNVHAENARMREDWPEEYYRFLQRALP